ncbi:MAG: hypothetical protein ACM30H_00125 [Clostridia bacterium]
MKKNSRAAIAVAGLLMCGSSFADCVMRNTSAAEKEYNVRAQASLREALPSAPANWTMKLSPSDPMDSVCADSHPGAFEVKVAAVYVWTRPKEDKARIYAERRKVEKEIDALRELPPDVKKERQAWLDKMSEANRASNAASKAGDKALARQKDSEAEGYSQKGRAVRDAYWQRIQPDVDKLQARAKSLNDADVRVEVVVIANERYPQRPPVDATKVVTAGKVPVANPGMKLQGARLMVVRSQPEGAQIEALVDEKKLNQIVQ